MLFFARYILVGHSMEPTFFAKDTLLVSEIVYFFIKPKRGDIIALLDTATKKILIKRITDIQDNKFYVVGDNKRDSIDSRQIGWIERKQIVGKVIYKV